MAAATCESYGLATRLLCYTCVLLGEHHVMGHIVAWLGPIASCAGLVHIPAPICKRPSSFCRYAWMVKPTEVELDDQFLPALGPGKLLALDTSMACLHLPHAFR